MTTVTTKPDIQVGAKTRTKSTVRPPRYAGRTGRVAEVRRVAPGRYEIGVEVFSGQVSWFHPEELEL
jgi:hypothetical protein